MGIIGAGTFAEANHYPSLSATRSRPSSIGLRSVTSMFERREPSPRYGWRPLHGRRRMLAASGSTGSWSAWAIRHPDLACEVLEAGLPVFLEKPSSVDIAGTGASPNGVRRVFVQVGHQKRHALAYRRALESSRPGSFGQTVHIEVKQLGSPVFPTFFTCMLEWQCHNLDLVRASVASRRGRAERPSSTSDMEVPAALLRFASGARPHRLGDVRGAGPFAERIEIRGDRNRGVTVANAREVTVFEEDVGESGRPTGTPSAGTRAMCQWLRAAAGALRRARPRGARRNPPSRTRSRRWTSSAIADRAGIPPTGRPSRARREPATKTWRTTSPRNPWRRSFDRAARGDRRPGRLCHRPTELACIGRRVVDRPAMIRARRTAAVPMAIASPTTGEVRPRRPLVPERAFPSCTGRRRRRLGGSLRSAGDRGRHQADGPDPRAERALAHRTGAARGPPGATSRKAERPRPDDESLPGFDQHVDRRRLCHTNGTGILSSKYGKLSDMVHQLEVVLPTGASFGARRSPTTPPGRTCRSCSSARRGRWASSPKPC